MESERYSEERCSNYLCQSASLVRKYVLNLAQVVGQVPRACEGSCVGFLIPDLVVEVNEGGLYCAHKLD